MSILKMASFVLYQCHLLREDSVSAVNVHELIESVLTEDFLSSHPK